MYNNEREIAQKAEKMLESALRSKTSSFARHLDNDKESVTDAMAKAKLKKYGTKKNANLSYYMRSLSVKMPKHGFVLDSGIEAGRVRKSGKRKSKTGKEYGFKAHVYKKGMAAKPFISDALKSSGVVDFVLENISQVRAEAIVVNIKNIIENK